MYKVLTAAEGKANNVPLHENKPDSWVTLVRYVGDRIDGFGGWFSNPATAQKICDARNAHFTDIKKAFKVVKDEELDGEVENNNSEAGEEVPVKRKRGRPKKIVSPVDSESKVCDNTLTGSEDAAEETTDE